VCRAAGSSSDGGSVRRSARSGRGTGATGDVVRRVLAGRAPDRATALRVGTALATGRGRCWPLGGDSGAGVGSAGTVVGVVEGAPVRGAEPTAISGVLRRLARSPEARAAPAARAP